MSKIENIIVNDKTYKVQTLGVIESFQLHLEVGKYLGPAIDAFFGNIEKAQRGEQITITNILKIFEKIEDIRAVPLIQKKVFAQVITPKNTFLSDSVAIEEWFADNKSDLWEVFIKALFVLVGEYLPNFANGMPNKPAAEAEASSQKNTY